MSIPGIQTEVPEHQFQETRTFQKKKETKHVDPIFGAVIHIILAWNTLCYPTASQLSETTRGSME